MMAKKINWTPEILAFIEKNQFGISRKELCQRLFAQFPNADPRINIDNLSNVCLRRHWLNGLDGRLKKGEIPWNKGVTGYMGANRTSFKKGQKAGNIRPLGSERICSKDGYVLIKVAEPSKWEKAHRIVWERHFGEVPKGHMIRHIDGDPTNNDIANLICIPRGANATINHHNKADTASPELNKAIILTEHLKYKTRKGAKNGEKSNRMG